MRKNSALWTKDFTIITVGTVISMFGNALSGFAISVLALDFSKSVFLYTLFMVAYSLPKVVMPILTGPVLDKHSRKKTIYCLDFTSCALYLGLYFYITFIGFSYPLFIVAAFLIGSIDSTYSVAYDSFYPNVIPEGFYRKAYSISSLIYTCSAVMVPVSIYVYEHVGIGVLFLFNSFSFLVAAIMETQIKTQEKHIEKEGISERFWTRFREGVKYLKGEKGLLYITIYSAVALFAINGSLTITMPYFRNGGPGIVSYMIIAGCGFLGRFVGGLYQYNHKYKAENRFAVAVTAYLVMCLADGIYLYFGVMIMAAIAFGVGILRAMSDNLRISSTQDYVPDEVRARFNGAFLMFCTFGSVMGQLSAGALADYFPIRGIVSAFMGLSLLTVIFCFVINRRHVGPIYNRALS